MIATYLKLSDLDAFGHDAINVGALAQRVRCASSSSRRLGTLADKTVNLFCKIAHNTVRLQEYK